MNYLFMNKDNPLLSFTIEDDGFETIKEQERFADKMPLGFESMNNWIANRNYAKHKDHLKKYLSVWGMDNTEGFINVTHCLGLNDTLWVKPENSDLTWDAVSLYRNEFSDICEKTAFETGLGGFRLESTSPEFVADGSFRKFWKKEDDGIYLYKLGSNLASNSGLEPYGEYYASKIAGSFHIPFVDYDLVMYKGDICTKCKIFTSEKTGYIPYSRIYNSVNIADVLLKCEELGFRDKAEIMFLIDSFVMNADRHLSNFGFLFDNDTFEITGFAPVFDFNLSMLCYLLDDEIRDTAFVDDYLKDHGHKLDGEFAAMGIALLNKVNIPNLSSLSLTRHEKYNVSDGRFEALSGYFDINKDRIVHKNLELHKVSRCEEKETGI